MNDEKRDRLIKYWKDGSKDSMQLAKIVFDKRFYSHSLFCCHLALEKLLKSKVIEQIDRHPPYSHDLLYLAGLAKIDLGEKEQEFLTKMNVYQIEGRYPDEKLELQKAINKTLTESILNETEAMYKWLSK